MLIADFFCLFDGAVRDDRSEIFKATMLATRGANRPQWAAYDAASASAAATSSLCGGLRGGAHDDDSHLQARGRVVGFRYNAEKWRERAQTRVADKKSLYLSRGERVGRAKAT